MNRYTNLYRIIAANNCSRLVEIGVFDGTKASQMIAVAQVNNDAVVYTGYDLFAPFEEGGDGYAKIPPSIERVAYLIKRTDVQFRLFKGDTRETLANREYTYDIEHADLVFIDGGHSHDVVASDWGNIQQVMGKDTIVVFDDYYIDPPAALAGLGCNGVIDALDTQQYDIEFLQPVDTFAKEWGEMHIQLVKVTRANA